MSATSRIARDDLGYPAGIEEALGRQPAIGVIGNMDLLNSQPLALFCSLKCPGDVILRVYDLVRAVRDAEIPVISGFHSPMERECLTLLLRGRQPFILCPARALDGMRVPTMLKKPLMDGRLLILSPFAKKQRRTTADMARTRNLFVAALADQILVAHAAPHSKTEAFFLQLLRWNKHLWTIPSDDNKHLISSGARALTPERVRELHTGAR
jgi:predicted Rossmann fold nucleotide-binding protein DprA/Smf involved in DNA uptake